jgi:putative DNA primase/helicase
MVLTGTAYRDRMLGRNEEIALDVRTLFVATSNNATISADLVRRSLHVRLESNVERPEQRTGFRIPDLLGHVRKHRATYLQAGLTLLRAYVVAGRPAVKLRPMGSYEAWSSVVRAPIVWAGWPDPGVTQDVLRADAEPEHDELGALLAAWHEHYGDRSVTTATLLADVRGDRDVLGAGALARMREALETVCDTPPGELPTPRRFGNYLRSVRGRIVAGMVVVPAAKSEEGRAWRIRRQ